MMRVHEAAGRRCKDSGHVVESVDAMWCSRCGSPVGAGSVALVLRPCDSCSAWTAHRDGVCTRCAAQESR